MDTQKLKEIDRIFRQFGIEAEDAFKLIATHYLNAHNPKNVSKGLKSFWNEGQFLIAKIKNDKIARQTLEYILANDYYGQSLPIIYQYFLGKRFRDLSGKFFTPQRLAWLMTAMLPIKKNAVIFDPTCGAGTFLVEASKRWKEVPCTLIGNDIDKMLVVLSEITILLNQESNRTLKFHNENIYDFSENFKTLFGKIDCILANPPFSLSIEAFTVGSKLFANGYRNSDALFLDLCLNLLKPAGYLVTLLPHSIVANKEFQKLRMIIEEDWEIAAVIIMPEGTFHATSNTTTRADILYLRKKAKKKLVKKILLGNVSDMTYLNHDNEEFLYRYDELAYLLGDLQINHTLN